jgi:hypothetical protein
VERGLKIQNYLGKIPTPECSIYKEISKKKAIGGKRIEAVYSSCFLYYRNIPIVL